MAFPATTNLDDTVSAQPPHLTLFEGKAEGSAVCPVYHPGKDDGFLDLCEDCLEYLSQRFGPRNGRRDIESLQLVGSSLALTVPCVADLMQSWIETLHRLLADDLADSHHDRLEVRLQAYQTWIARPVPHEVVKGYAAVRAKVGERYEPRAALYFETELRSGRDIHVEILPHPERVVRRFWSGRAP